MSDDDWKNPWRPKGAVPPKPKFKIGDVINAYSGGPGIDYHTHLVTEVEDHGWDGYVLKGVCLDHGDDWPVREIRGYSIVHAKNLDEGIIFGGQQRRQGRYTLWQLLAEYRSTCTTEFCSKGNHIECSQCGKPTDCDNDGLCVECFNADFERD